MENKRKFYEFETRFLIQRLTQFEEGEENFTKCLEFALDSFVYHSYLDVDPFKVKKRICGFSEKFLIQADDEKANKLNNLVSRYYDLLSKEDTHQRDTGFAVLDLLIRLACSYEVTERILDNENEEDQQIISNINWKEYLRDAEGPFIYSDTSSVWSESESDSPSSSIYLTYGAPANTDSGIETTPDGNSTSKYIPPQAPFQIRKKNKEEDKRKRTSYWEPKEQVTKLGPSSSNLSLNFTEKWEKHLAEESLIYTPETNVVLSEAVIVRETLWMLHGLKDLYLYPYVNGHYTVLSHAHMKHITENTLQEMLTPFCEYGEKLISLMDFTNQCLSLENHFMNNCPSYHAYACSLSYFITQYRSVLTSYEQLVINKNLITLMQLKQKLGQYFNELDLLFDIHSQVVEQLPNNELSWEHSMAFINILWKQIIECSVWTRDKSMFRIPFFLFLTCLRPFLQILERAIVRGQFVDKSGKFFIEKNEEVGILSETFWDDALHFRIVPADLERQFFLKPLFSDILLACKSMQMLHYLQHSYDYYKQSDSIPDFLFTLFIENLRDTYSNHNSRHLDSNVGNSIGIFSSHVPEDLAVHFKKLKQIKDKHIDVKKYWKLCEKLLDIIQPNCTLLLHTVIEQTLIPCIQTACQYTSKELVNCLKEKHNLLFHLSVVQKYFLMMSGDVMFAFYSEVFNKMLDKDFLVDLMFMNSALAETIFHSDSKSSEKLTLSLKEGYNKDLAPLDQLALLNLSYDVGWPINVILNSEAQQNYSRIFGFLLQIKCAKYYLDELYCYSLEGDSQPTSLLSKEMPASQKRHGMYILRMKMLHYINGFHYFIMNRSLYSSEIELNEKLENIESLEDILVEHRNYLSNLLTRCLFDSKLPYLQEQVLKLLTLALRVHSLWMLGISKISEGDLKSLEYEFSSCINLLKSYMSKPLIRGKSAHLQDLAEVFLTECHLQYTFQ